MSSVRRPTTQIIHSLMPKLEMMSANHEATRSLQHPLPHLLRFKQNHSNSGPIKLSTSPDYSTSFTHKTDAFGVLVLWSSMEKQYSSKSETKGHTSLSLFSVLFLQSFTHLQNILRHDSCHIIPNSETISKWKPKLPKPFKIWLLISLLALTSDNFTH